MIAREFPDTVAERVEWLYLQDGTERSIEMARHDAAEDRRNAAKKKASSGKKKAFGGKKAAPFKKGGGRKRR